MIKYIIMLTKLIKKRQTAKQTTQIEGKIHRIIKKRHSRPRKKQVGSESREPQDCYCILFPCGSVKYKSGEIAVVV